MFGEGFPEVAMAAWLPSWNEIIDPLPSPISLTFPAQEQPSNSRWISKSQSSNWADVFEAPQMTSL